ncbi:uncharacterized protein B0H64DRAFT_374970 [Chaetomium fimeti]|uniref:Uncharacterized protein n=1 Tax=Chaetomium fimeti TaxID=1854472 RepID=A0AAE0HD07_9PEZI|nr:hypothetical protein B0H64DRAFT_374970 [Chaetomium fimeti]
MSAGTGNARAAPAPRLPIFGVEIEMFVKIKPRLEVLTREKQRLKTPLPEHWNLWDFDLKNDYDEEHKIDAVFQRRYVCGAAKEAIDAALGPDNGWSCEIDLSVKERLLTLPIDPRKWWGIEVVSPPMSVSKQWQQEIDMVFKAIGKVFDIWTNNTCGCHGAFFWEEPLRDFLPPERRSNTYALPNHTILATDEYKAVPRAGWGPVFAAIEAPATGERAQSKLLTALQGPGDDWTRYLSTNFAPFNDIKTVELRRQAGTASPTTTVHRILLAVTLHLSAMRYNFDGAGSRLTYPTAEELRKELAGCVKKLPETCHGSRFVNWLNWCYESYKDNRSFSEQQINDREDALRKGRPPPDQVPALVSGPRPAATSGAAGQAQQQRGRTPTVQTSTPSRAPARTPAPQGGRQTAPAGRANTGREPAAPARAPRDPPAQGSTSRGSGGGGGGGGGGGRAPPARQGSGPGGAGASTSASRGSAARTTGGGGPGGTTTRLPERPAAPRPAAAGNTGNTTGGSAPRRRSPSPGTRPLRRRPAANDTQG